jgi:hypothetical protein
MRAGRRSGGERPTGAVAAVGEAGAYNRRLLHIPGSAPPSSSTSSEAIYKRIFWTDFLEEGAKI